MVCSRPVPLLGFGFNGKVKGHWAPSHRPCVVLKTQGRLYPVPAVAAATLRPPARFPGARAARTCDAEALEAVEVSHAEPRPGQLGARLVETHAQVGRQPRRGKPGGSRAEVRGDAGHWGGGGGRAAGRPGQDGLDGEGRLEAPGSAGPAWTRGAALELRGLVSCARGSGRPAASRHWAGHGAAPALSGTGSEATACGQPCREREGRGGAPRKRERDLLARSIPGGGRGLLNLARRGGAGVGLFFQPPRRGHQRAAKPPPSKAGQAAKSRWALPPLTPYLKMPSLVRSEKDPSSLQLHLGLSRL